jgi:putative DNA primase/helicase
VTFQDSPAVAEITSQSSRTELANAQRFIDLHGEKLRYVPAWDKWLVWRGTHWQIDDGCQIETLARDVVEQVWTGVELNMRLVERSEATSMVSFARATASANGMANFLKLARSEPGIPIQPSELDKNEWLLNVENGTIDLRTGKRRAHDKRDFITKIAPVLHTEHRTSETWERFVAEIMAGDAELIGFLQRLCGYWLTGSIRDHVLPIFHGTGANGKSVFLGTIEAMLGTDYAMHAPPDLLMVKRHEAHPTERADLFGKRLVTCIETEAGRRLAESLVKELTGGDAIRARRMREDHWQFTPSHKLVIAANHRPIVYGTDNGIWRRLRLVPFNVTIPPERQDKQLADKLKRELNGVLTWCIRGCLEWQAKGLAEPSIVMGATDVYREEQDVFADFLEDCCLLDCNATIGGGRLYKAYQEWCKASGHDPDNSTVFGRKLSERGLPSRKTEHGKLRLGVALLTVPKREADQS